MTEQQLKTVGMGDLQVVNKSGILKTTGLGSCVGLTLFDPIQQIAGMAHIMLPSSSIAREQPINSAKYADSAIPELIDKMVACGASVRNMEAKMAGGAQMFKLPGQHEMMRIGPRNVEACKKLLEELAIPLVGEDTGGNYGRTIELNGATGILTIRSVNKQLKEI